MFDAAELTPAPWRFIAPSYRISCHIVGGSDSGMMDMMDDQKFCAAARNAFAAQMEYGWTARRITGGPWAGAWRVDDMGGDMFNMGIV
jgi:hypothetical protein